MPTYAICAVLENKWWETESGRKSKEAQWEQVRKALEPYDGIRSTHVELSKETNVLFYRFEVVTRAEGEEKKDLQSKL